jgi:GDP/UDP-N,N'-diacetylbacillosamine 2-epimerase (hydrolysing)
MVKSKRRVLCITGIRSEYYLQRSIFRAIADHPELELQLVVTGAHLSPLHGYSVRDIEADGFPILERIESLLWSSNDTGRIRGAGMQLQILAHILGRERPHWVLAPCDREEALTMATCASYLQIPIAHLAAGDRVVGNVDDMVRHAVSRLSHLLLAISDDAGKRLLQSGEQPFRVHTVGHPGLDRLRSTRQMKPEEVASELEVELGQAPFLLIIQHVISSEIGEAAAQMEATMQALERLQLPAIVVHPNSDAGSQDIIGVIRDYSEQLPFVHAFANIRDDVFVNLLRHAFALIGNSSLGLLEAPFVGLPVINVGNRQKARFHADNIVFLPHRADAIVDQVKRWLADREEYETYRQCHNPFGDGRSGERVANLLAQTRLDEEFLIKDLTF